MTLMLNAKYIVTEQMYNDYCENYTVVPVLKKTAFKEDILSMLDLNILDIFNDKYQLLLHSPKGGRYSYLAIKNSCYFTGNYDGLYIDRDTDYKREFIPGNPLQLLEQVFSQYRAPIIENAPDFYGGLIGYFSYDIVRLIENIPDISHNDLDLPLYFFGLVTDGIAIDHKEQQLCIFANKAADESYNELVERIEDIEVAINEIIANSIRNDKYVHDELQDELLIEDNGKPASVNDVYNYNIDEALATFSESEFCNASDRIIEYIKAGDVFQVNLSVRHGIETDKTPYDIYRTLVKNNPSPYMAYIHTPQFAIASSSPELLVKVKDQLVGTRPIAGTRSRGINEEQETELINDLLSNEKELAEHIMLVDLERNDLGRICEYGSVTVDELFTLEKYSHVIHLVSNVRGKLRADKNLFDVIRAVFPGGTITGAPKVRTMEIIEELEPVKRGLYTGSIGWIGFQQDMEFNIVIRTAIIKDNWAYVQAGAGIVYDSIPKREYKESLKKARAVWEAIRG
jgi:para-aminobenzoate synthetase component 1